MRGLVAKDQLWFRWKISILVGVPESSFDDLSIRLYYVVHQLNEEQVELRMAPSRKINAIVEVQLDIGGSHVAGKVSYDSRMFGFDGALHRCSATKERTRSQQEDYIALCNPRTAL